MQAARFAKDTNTWSNLLLSHYLSPYNTPRNTRLHRRTRRNLITFHLIAFRDACYHHTARNHKTHVSTSFIHRLQRYRPLQTRSEHTDCVEALRYHIWLSTQLTAVRTDKPYTFPFYLYIGKLRSIYTMECTHARL